jgi:hypothetical protein
MQIIECSNNQKTPARISLNSEDLKKLKTKISSEEYKDLNKMNAIELSLKIRTNKPYHEKTEKLDQRTIEKLLIENYKDSNVRKNDTDYKPTYPIYEPMSIEEPFINTAEPEEVHTISVPMGTNIIEPKQYIHQINQTIEIKQDIHKINSHIEVKLEEDIYPISLPKFKRGKIPSPIEIYGNIYKPISKNRNITPKYKISNTDRELLIKMIINMTDSKYLRFLYYTEYISPLLIKYNNKSKKISIFLSINNVSHTISPNVFLTYHLFDIFNSGEFDNFVKGINIYISKDLNCLWEKFKNPQIPTIINEFRDIYKCIVSTMSIGEFINSETMSPILVHVDPNNKKISDDNHYYRNLRINTFHQYEMPLEIPNKKPTNMQLQKSDTDNSSDV